MPRRKRNRLGWTSTALLLPASVHPALADATAPTSNGRPLERVADDSKHPRRPDRSSSTRDRLHTDPATPAPSRPSELASPSGQRARAGGRPRRRLLSRFAVAELTGRNSDAARVCRCRRRLAHCHVPITRVKSPGRSNSLRGVDAPGSPRRPSARVRVVDRATVYATMHAIGLVDNRLLGRHGRGLRG